jgi:hypothetical protein
MGLNQCRSGMYNEDRRREWIDHMQNLRSVERHRANKPRDCIMFAPILPMPDMNMVSFAYPTKCTNGV